MRLAALFLCDAASVREGLLHVLGGAINVVTRDSYPAPLGVALVVVAEVNGDESAHPHKLTVEIAARHSPEPMIKIEGGWENQGELPDPAMQAYVPVVINLSALALPAPGYYDVRVEVEGMESRSLSLRADATTPPD